MVPVFMRKKQTEFRAIQFTKDTLLECVKFVGGNCKVTFFGKGDMQMLVKGEYGESIVSLNHWIVKVWGADFEVYDTDKLLQEFEYVRDEA